MALIKNSTDLMAMRESGRMLAQVLKYLGTATKAGLKTKELSVLAKVELKKLGGEPAFLGYSGFPDIICISVNDEVVHGIPSERVLQTGDLVGLDFGVRYRGMITDAAITVIVSKTKPAAQKLVEITEKSLLLGIDQVKNGVHVGSIGAAIEAELRRYNFGVIENLVGHGVGYALHEPPEIPNFGTAGQGPILKAGMTIAIEPMATLGAKAVYIDRDGWTVKTRDASLSAHFEHTVLVTDKGAEILTAVS